MIKIELNQNELSRLAEFAAKQLDSGHMGSDDFIVPEYQILKDKITAATYFIELNNTEVEVLCDWIYEGVSKSRIRKIEDELLAAKIYDSVYAEFKNIKSDYLFRIMKLKTSLNVIAKLAGKEELGNAD
jgi:hypothetical protein